LDVVQTGATECSQWKVSRPIRKESKKKRNTQPQFEKQAAPFSNVFFWGVLDEYTSDFICQRRFGSSGNGYRLAPKASQIFVILVRARLPEKNTTNTIFSTCYIGMYVTISGKKYKITTTLSTGWS
jgi:hypothetical protein